MIIKHFKPLVHFLLSTFNFSLKFSILAYHKKESYDEDITNKLKEHYQSILFEIGEDPQREGLLKTPERVAKAMQFITQGYAMNAADILNSAKFHESYSEMVLVKNIELY